MHYFQVEGWALGYVPIQIFRLLRFSNILRPYILKVVRQLVSEFVGKHFCTRYQVLPHLWRIKPVPCQVVKYYDEHNSCFDDFTFIKTLTQFADKLFECV